MEERRFKNGSDVNVYNKKDILDMLNSSSEEKVIIEDIIDSFVEHATSCISKNLAVSIPYTIVIQNSILTEFNKQYYNEISAIKEKVDKSETNDKIRDLYKSVREDIIINRGKKHFINKCKKRNNRLYKKYAKTYGLVYADTYLFCLSLCHVIPFDEEDIKI